MSGKDDVNGNKTTGWDQLFSKISDRMGSALHGCRYSDRPFHTGRAGDVGTDGNFRDLHTDCDSHLDYDLSDDDQGGFPECEGGREESERSLRHMGCQLADQAVYDVRLCLAVSLCDI